MRVTFPFGLFEFECGCNIIHRQSDEGKLTIIRCINHSNITEKGYLRTIKLTPLHYQTITEIVST